MAQRDNILKELNELQSSLINVMPQNIYQVPTGYFEGLAEQVLNRIRSLEADNAAEELSYLSPLLKSISNKSSYSVPAGYFDNLPGQVLNRLKALETANVAEELNYLSPLLNGISKKLPFTVPDGYFDSLEETIRLSMQSESNVETTEEELASLSPLLGGLKKEMPYSVPQGYFEGLSSGLKTEPVKSAGKVTSFAKQNWFRYAAAAVVTGVIVTAGFLFLNKNERIDPSEKSYAWVKKSVKKVSTDDIDKFVQLADEAVPVIASVDVAADAKIEIKELIKDIPDSEIQDFLEETQAEEPDAEDVLLN